MKHLRWLAVVALAAAVGPLTPGPLRGQGMTQDEALALAFPKADEIQRRTAYLGDDQLARIADLAGPDVGRPSGILTHYVAMVGGIGVGVAYFDAHRVRTLDAVLMIVVGADDRLLRVETVISREPPDYWAPEGWLDLFDGRELDDDLSVKGTIPNITGATLTARATTAAVRRVLAAHQVIRPLKGGEGIP